MGLDKKKKQLHGLTRGSWLEVCHFRHYIMTSLSGCHETSPTFVSLKCIYFSFWIPVLSILDAVAIGIEVMFLLFVIVKHQSIGSDEGLSLRFWSFCNHWFEKIVVYRWQTRHFWISWIPCVTSINPYLMSLFRDESSFLVSILDL